MAKSLTNEREAKIEPVKSSIALGIASLTDKKTGLLMIDTQERADKAGGLIRQIDTTEESWKFQWYGTPENPGELRKADLLYARYRAVTKIFSAWKTQLKSGIGQWRQREEKKRLEHAAEINRIHRQKYPTEAFVYNLPPVEVEGTTAVKRKKAVVVDLMALVKAVAKGKADLACLEANQTYLDTLAREKWGLRDKDGFIIAGIKAIEIESERLK